MINAIYDRFCFCKPYTTSTHPTQYTPPTKNKQLNTPINKTTEIKKKGERINKDYNKRKTNTQLLGH